MKGLEVSELIFRQRFLPLVKKELPDAIPSFAAGLVGEGSECFGYDDEISCDHDNEPRLCIWLEDAQMEQYGTVLKELLDRSLSEREDGLQTPRPFSRSGVFLISNFYCSLIRRQDAPQTNEEWMQTEETMLAAAVNGAVFYDGAGKFMAIRNKLLSYYPEDVRRVKLAQALAKAAQTGQYNYLRALKREEAAAAEMMKGIFVDQCLRASFYLQKIFRPYYKWTFRRLRESGDFGDRISSIAEELYFQHGVKAADLIEAMSAELIRELKAQRLSVCESSFLMDHLEDLLSEVQDRDLLKNGISLVLP